MKIRELMKKVKEREQNKEGKIGNDKNAPVKALWRSEKFDHVESKVKDLMIVIVIFFISFYLNMW